MLQTPADNAAALNLLRLKDYVQILSLDSRPPQKIVPWIQCHSIYTQFCVHCHCTLVMISVSIHFFNCLIKIAKIGLFECLYP